MTTETTRPTAVLTMGLPGSGKSTVVARQGFDKMLLIDPDLVKASHPDYDPKNPGALHEWSKQVTEAQIADAIANRTDMVIDGTGTNVEKMVQRINNLQANGYRVTVLYVSVSLKTALARNAARDRVVPEAIVREKAEVIATAAEIVAHYADEMQVIAND
jgi:predicted kinase